MRKRITKTFFVVCISLCPTQFIHGETTGSSGRLSLEETEVVSDYAKYGEFENLNEHQFRYVITDRSGLVEAVGPGVYPNKADLRTDLRYQEMNRDGALEGPLEKFLPDVDPELAFYKWGSLKGVPYQGLRQFNIGRCFELLGYPKRAFNAYYSAVLNFPREICWQNGRPWYVGVAALDAAYRLLEEHPEWELQLEGARIDIQNGFDKKGTNDRFVINPGRFVKGPVPAEDVLTKLGRERQTRGHGEVRLAKYGNGHWQLLVDNEPYVVRGICYSPSPVGRSPDLDGYLPHSDWMTLDDNHNGLVDAPYDAWVDANRDNAQDESEPAVGDFELMRRMGANTVRLYHHGDNKPLLRDLNRRYGMRVLMGDLMGAYTVGSGAEWEDGTDYSNAEQRQRMRESIRSMVMEHRNEPYILMWVLGNENNYGEKNNANRDPIAFYKFAETMARMVRALDPNHPVALCNGELDNLDLIAQYCPSVDVIAINAYRGENGLGSSFWRTIDRVWKKPVLVSEFGAPAYNQIQSQEQAEDFQARYLLAGWDDVVKHAAGHQVGNAIGGVIFSWVDEWWKAGPSFEPWVHDELPQSRGPFPGGFMYEEWLGITSQGDGEHSPYLRQLRPAYYAFRDGPWKEPMFFKQRSTAVWRVVQ